MCARECVCVWCVRACMSVCVACVCGICVFHECMHVCACACVCVCARVGV